MTHPTEQKKKRIYRKKSYFNNGENSFDYHFGSYIFYFPNSIIESEIPPNIWYAQFSVERVKN